MTAPKQRRCRFFAALFPRRCVLCDALVSFRRVCCTACSHALPSILPPLCEYCGQHKRHCGCGKRRHAFERIVAPFYYEQPVQSGIVRLKFRDNPDAVEYFAEQMQHVVEREYAEHTFAAVTFVPMSPRDLHARGYNQGRLLAEALGERLQLPVWDTLVKLYDTPPQKDCDFFQRSGNVLGAFDVIHPAVRGKTILLVDDVMTTGLTLHECAKMLKISGAACVPAVTVAVRKHTKKTDED